MEENRAYFAKRAAQEQSQADQAKDPHAADAHRRLQRAYLERATVGDREEKNESAN